MVLELQNHHLSHFNNPMLVVFLATNATRPFTAAYRTRRASSSPLRLAKVSQFTGEKTMSRRNGPKLDLKLNLTPSRANHPPEESPSRSLTVDLTSPHNSCVSSDESRSASPEATSMMLVGCPRCLMYVMLPQEDPRCPKCKSTVLLDVIHDTNNASNRKTEKS